MKKDTDKCPLGEINLQAAIASAPTNGTIDARYPHQAGNPSARLGIGANTAGNQIMIKLEYDGQPVVEVDDPDCWCLCETEIDGNNGCNSIASVLPVAGSPGVHKIVLDHPITAGATTTISYRHGNNAMRFTSHPGNADANTVTSPSDILGLIDMINGVIPKPWGVYSCDINHNGVCGESDVSAELNLLYGAQGFANWNYTGLPSVAPCPHSAGCREADGACPEFFSVSKNLANDAKLDLAAENEKFLEYLVTFLLTVNPEESSIISPQFTLETLTKWATANFGQGERKTLIQQIIGPEVEFTSEWGRQAAMDLVRTLNQLPPRS